jgi:hypothetical protein
VPPVTCSDIFLMRSTRWIFIFLALIVGVGMGLTYGWVIDPVDFFNLTPDTLRADYKADYVLMTAEAYRVEQDPGLAARRSSAPNPPPPSPLKVSTTHAQTDSPIRMSSSCRNLLLRYKPGVGYHETHPLGISSCTSHPASFGACGWSRLLMDDFTRARLRYRTPPVTPGFQGPVPLRHRRGIRRNQKSPRAQARLSLLGDDDPIETLNAQAQRMLASGQSFEQADQVAALALALGDHGSVVPTSTKEVVTEIANNTNNTPTATLPPPPPDVPIELTETPQAIETQPTQPIIVESTPRPTRTPLATPGTPFKLTGQATTCDPNLPDGLLQVIVSNSNRRQMAGIEIIVTWDGGEEQFFTGFKPEIGNGYADFVMNPNITYTVQLGRGSDIATGLTTPTCQTSGGETFFGGIKLTFQQP